MARPKFMKKFLRGVAVLCGILLALPLLLMITGKIASFAFFYRSLSHRDTTSCTQYYEGVSKGTVWEDGEWHHYVDFKIDGTSSFRRLRVTAAPLPTTLWRKYSTESTKRFAYQWPSNWWDPFPAKDWKICAVNS
jgi:hypothetical protein